MAGIDFASKQKVAFVCSGGAVKAATFHTGVALALEHAGFQFLGGTQAERGEMPALDPSKLIQVYVGSSAGSLLTNFLAQGGSIEKMISSFQKDSKVEGIPGLKYWEMLHPRVSSKSDLIGFDSFLIKILKNRKLQSPFSTEGISRYIRTHINKTDVFSELEADLFVVATELNTSKKVIFGKYKSASSDSYTEYRNDVSISDACACSMSLPPVYHPFRLQIEGQVKDYYDGEIREPLSNHVARETGCDLIICSYTHQPMQLRNQTTLASRGIQDIVVQALYQSIEEKIQRSRGYRLKEKALIDTVKKFFKDNELSNALCDNLVNKLEQRMTYKDKVDYIYIRPKPSDLEMFSMPHFSLNRKHTESLVKKGFLSGSMALRGFLRNKNY